MNPAELAAQLKALYEAQDEGLRLEWDRSLPFADGLLDRWERARRLGFGEDASIYNSALVYGDVSVGRGTWIGPYTLLDGSGGGLSIGAYCSISAGVQIIRTTRSCGPYRVAKRRKRQPRGQSASAAISAARR